MEDFTGVITGEKKKLAARIKKLKGEDEEDDPKKGKKKGKKKK